MLTRDQIVAARNMVATIKAGAEDEAAEALSEDDDYREEREANAREALEDAAILDDALGMIAAYERVAALLEQWHVGHDTCAWKESMGLLYDELRRALEGK